MRHGSLFSGIGGFDLAAEWMGWENVFHCEWNEFGQKVLKYYWPKSISYGDITKTDFTVHRGQIDIITGGFPCQPFSAAGKRKGKEDDRYLWPEMLRAIREIHSSWIIGENVGGIISMVQPGSEIEVESQATFFEANNKETILEQEYVIETICFDLEREGYSVQPILIPACAVGAPHRRDRVWFVAHNSGIRDGDTEKEFYSGRYNIRSSACTKRFNSDSTIEGLQEWQPDNRRTDSEENRTGMDDRSERPGNIGTTSDSGLLRSEISEEQTAGIKQCNERINSNTSNQGLQGRELYEASKSGRNKRKREDKRQSCKSITELCQTPNWIDFPTQSPLCSRNDGVSTGLSGITFSKHRNESIKAYGNAIVPQIAFQIFKAIESVEFNYL